MVSKQQIGIIMGSDSDLQIMQQAAQILDEFGIAYELTVVSAHRTPERMFEYAKTALEKKLSVIIAGAGGAAHLPGMVAALTPLPVIGVPIQTKTMDGVDSLFSIVQMPPGVPVATVAINGAKNAGLLAVEILAIGDEGLSKKLLTYKNKQNIKVTENGEHLKKIGYKEYLKIMKKN